MPAVSEDAAEELPALSAASVATLRLEAEKERNKEVRALKLALPRLYATIMTIVSPESKEEIRQHPDFEAADLAKDANVLWRIITETHLTAVHRVSDSMRVFDQMSLRTRFAHLRQKHGVSIGVFKQEYDELKVFLSKLDIVRYGEMFSFLTNRAHMGKNFPATLHDAWQVASKWTVSGPGDGKMDASGELLSIFALEDEQAPPLRSGHSGGGSTGRGSGRSGSGVSGGRGGGATGAGVMVAMTMDKHSPTGASGPVVLSMFRNARLLTDTRRLKRPVCIGGVDGSSEGIRVETDGNFENLG
jgi:uncharacterized membrane protein YgcG